MKRLKILVARNHMASSNEVFIDALEQVNEAALQRRSLRTLLVCVFLRVLAFAQFETIFGIKRTTCTLFVVDLMLQDRANSNAISHSDSDSDMILSSGNL